MKRRTVTLITRVILASVIMMMIVILMFMTMTLATLLRRDRLSEMLVMKVWNDGLAK